MLVSDSGAGNVVYHLYGNGHLGQQAQGSSQFQTFVTDGLGSVRVEMETSGRTNYVRTFSPFGETLDEIGNRSSVYGYTGQQEDASTGLIYLRARYYSAELKLFTAYDLWNGVNRRPQSLNHYAYTEGNPINLIDPTGQYGCGPNGYLDCSDGSETPDPHPSTVRAVDDWLDGWAQVGSAAWHSTASYATDRDAFNNQWQNNYEAGRNLAISGYRHSPINMVVNPRNFGQTWQNTFLGVCAGVQSGWDTLRNDPVYGISRGALFAGEVWAGAYFGKATLVDDVVVSRGPRRQFGYVDDLPVDTTFTSAFNEKTGDIYLMPSTYDIPPYKPPREVDGVLWAPAQGGHMDVVELPGAKDAALKDLWGFAITFEGTETLNVISWKSGGLNQRLSDNFTNEFVPSDVQQEILTSLRQEYPGWTIHVNTKYD